MEKKNPLLAGLLSLIPQAVGTISTLIKDKKERKEEAKAEATTTAGAIVDSLKDAVSGSISSKRLLNIGGTTLIITVAMGDITAHGLSKLNLALICIGAAYSVSMSLITTYGEKK